MPASQRVAIVGVGLIGGSIGLALRERELAIDVIGVGHRRSTLEKAIARGAIDHGTTNLVEGVTGADWVVVATPVGSIVDTIQSIAAANERCTITDVGSTKAEICSRLRAPVSPDSWQKRPGPSRFIGSHPLAGDHRTGPEHARADLFEGRTVVVTPEDDTPPGLVERASEFWRSLGATVELLSPEEHDRALAATSHLPHLIAAALAAATPEVWLRLAATGWGDTTRIGASDPGLWTQIFGQNRDGVRDALTRFRHVLDAMETAVSEGDDATLATQLQEAKRIRDLFSET